MALRPLANHAHSAQVQIEKNKLSFKSGGERKTVEIKTVKTDRFQASTEYREFVKEQKAKAEKQGETVFLNGSYAGSFRKDLKNGGIRIQLENAEDLLNLAEDGYIEMDGQKILLTDEEKKTFKKLGKDIQSYNEMAEKLGNAVKDAENAKEQGEAEAKAMQEKWNLLKIAMLYGTGKAVNEKDLNHLREKDPKLYSVAVSMRALQEKVEEDKDKKSILEDEKEDTDTKVEAVPLTSKKAEIHLSSEGKLISVQAAASEQSS